MLLLYEVIIVASKDTFLVTACKSGDEMMIVNKIVHFHPQFVLILRQLQAYINPLDYHEKLGGFSGRDIRKEAQEAEAFIKQADTPFMLMVNYHF